VLSGSVLDLNGRRNTLAAVTLAGGTVRNGTLQAGSYTLQAGAVSADLSGPVTVVKNSLGTLVLGAANSYSGGLSVNAGALQVNHADAIPVPAATTGQDLYVGDCAQVVLGAGLGKAVQVRGLTMYGGASPTGTMDLKNGQLVVDGTVTPVATIGARIAKGYNPDDPDNPWKGPGITSSDAAAHAERYAVGYALNSDYGELAWGTWFGRTVNPDSILVRFTYQGDVDLSGEVTTDDFDNWKQGYITHMSGWLHGDLDYSGDVTTDDFDLWKQVYVKHYAPMGDGSGGGKIAAAAVPEPGTPVLLALGGLGLFGWAWRRRRSVTNLLAAAVAMVVLVVLGPGTATAR
jgi:autotransporter-associated beta strand protein